MERHLTGCQRPAQHHLRPFEFFSGQSLTEPHEAFPVLDDDAQVLEELFIRHTEVDVLDLRRWDSSDLLRVLAPGARVLNASRRGGKRPAKGDFLKDGPQQEASIERRAERMSTGCREARCRNPNARAQSSAKTVAQPKVMTSAMAAFTTNRGLQPQPGNRNSNP